MSIATPISMAQPRYTAETPKGSALHLLHLLPCDFYFRPSIGVEDGVECGKVIHMVITGLTG